MTYVYNTKEYQERAKHMAAARWAAIWRLQEAHRDEYEAYHREERVARGLPADPLPKRARYTELRERVEELEAELARVKGGA